MKNSHLIKILPLLILTFSLSSCEVVGAIFKTGVGIGIFVTVSVLIIIGIIIAVIRGRSK